MAQETKFVPGPYEAIGQSVFAYGEDGTNRMSVLVQDPYTSTEALKASAKLFAAAPELYEALVEAIAELDECALELLGENYNSPKFNAILAKARGE